MSPRPTAMRLFLAFLCAAALRGQSLELRTGEVVVGRVTALSDDALTLTTGDAAAPERTFARAEVAPRSWLQLLTARADGADPAAHERLAETAAQLGLPGHAIGELQLALRLDPARRTALAPRLAALRTQVAQDLLAQAQEALAAGRAGEAKLQAQVVAEKYGDTAAAPGARELVRQAVTRLRTAAAAAATAPDAKVVAEAAKLEQRADQLALPAHGGIGASVQETRTREQAAKLLAEAFALLQKSGGDAAEAARTRVRDKLRDQYLALATNLLQRRSLDRATEFNGLACALDPEGGGCHHVQDLIVQARLTFGY